MNRQHFWRAGVSQPATLQIDYSEPGHSTPRAAMVNSMAPARMANVKIQLNSFICLLLDNLQHLFGVLADGRLSAPHPDSQVMARSRNAAVSPLLRGQRAGRIRHEPFGKASEHESIARHEAAQVKVTRGVCRLLHVRLAFIEP